MTAKGNSLIEYILPAAILGVVLLVSCGLLVPSLQGILPSSFNGEKATINGNEKGLSIHAMGKDPNASELTLTLADGTIITIPDYPKNLSLSIETVGTNGTTERLLAALNALIEKLSAEQKLSPTQALALKNLANKGHDIAHLERILEEAGLNAGNNAKALKDSDFTWKGEKLTAHNVAILIGGGDGTYATERSEQLLQDVSPGSVFSQWSTNPKGGNESYAFTELYNKAKQSGALADPAVDTLVQRLARNIFDIGQTFAATVHEATNPEDFDNPVRPAELSQDVASKISDNHSANICEVSAENKDTGIQCH